MQYFVAIFFSFMTMSFNKKKVIFLLFTLFLWLLASNNYDIADKINYYYHYLESSSMNGLLRNEIGQQFTYKISNYLGLSFSTYLSIYYFIGLLLISRVIMKYTNNPGYVIVLYFFYPFIIDVAQIRNFMAMAIMLNAIPLLSSNKKIDSIKYVFLLLLATSFHQAAIFCVLFLLIKMFDMKKLIKIVILLTLIGSLFNVVLVKFLIDTMPFLEQKMYRYTHSSVSLYTQIGLLIYLSFGLLLVYIARKRLEKIEFKKITSSLIDVIFLINVMMFLLYPFLLYAFEFIRIYRNILILNYILFANVFVFKRDSLMKDLFYNFSIVIFVVFSLWYFIYYQFSDTVFFPLFEYNNLFE
jgi:hypothetical protein